ncbi:MAG: EF-P lysine aminoacylase GenX [Alphaproteobacteria bacterium]|nr:EF-P lysine aminoacylase GenX [Alphaproteobacteria bacterium]
MSGAGGARWWEPERHAARRANLAARARIARAVRDWFGAQGFVEVETPALQVSPGLEPHLHAFATALGGPGDAAAVPRYLHTSPEFTMKKLLAAGERRIFQLTHVFRDRERGPTHHPEFTMLEWYRADADYRTLFSDCADILGAALVAGGRGAFSWQGREAQLRGPIERLSVAEAFARATGIDLLATAPDPARPDRARLAAAAKRVGIRTDAADTWDDIFFRILLERIEPTLGSPTPTVLYDYPSSMAALARPSAADPRLSERCELYVCGLELANGWSELTDGAEQRRRFAADRARRRAIYGEAYPVDEDFLAALARMPPAAGMALGFDRLVMVALGAASIEDVLWAPVDGGG